MPPDSPGDVRSGAWPPNAPALLADDVRDWSRRLPTAVVRWLTFAALAVAVGASTVLDGDSAVVAAVAESPRYLFVGVTQATAMAAIVLAFFRPALAAVLGAASSLTIARIPEANAGMPGLWFAVSLILVVLTAVWALARARQRAVGRAWFGRTTGVPLVPGVPRPLHDFLVGPPVARLAMAALALVVGLGGLALLVHDSRAAADFRSGADVAWTTVTSANDDRTGVTVAIDGTTYEVPLTSADLQPEQQIEVRYSPETLRAEATADVFDPTLATIPAVGGLLAAVALYASARRRRRDLTELLTEGGPAFQVRATWSQRDDGALLFALDDPSRVIAVAPDLIAWLEGSEPDGDGCTWSRGMSWSSGDEDEPEIGELEPRPAVEMSDAELLAMARSLAESEHVHPEDRDESEAYLGPQPLAVTWDRTPVTVVGLRHDGAPVALCDAEGRWYVTQRPLRGLRMRWPWTAWAEARRAGQGAQGPGASTIPGIPAATTPPAAPRPIGTTRQADANDPAKPRTFEERYDSVFERFYRRTGRWLPWVMAPVAWWVFRWMFAEISIWQIVFASGSLVSAAWTWSQTAQVRLEIKPRWLLFRGGFRDELVAWSRITSILSDEASLVIRLDHDNASKGDAMLLTTDPEALPLMRGHTDPREVDGLLERARIGHLGSAPPLVRWRPSVPAVVAACWLAAAVVAFAQTR